MSEQLKCSCSAGPAGGYGSVWRRIFHITQIWLDKTARRFTEWPDFPSGRFARRCCFCYYNPAAVILTYTRDTVCFLKESWATSTRRARRHWVFFMTSKTVVELARLMQCRWLHQRYGCSPRRVAQRCVGFGNKSPASGARLGFAKEWIAIVAYERD